MNELYAAAETALRDCLELKGSETLLVLTDDVKQDIGNVLFEVGKKIASEAALAVMPVRKVNGEEPPAVLADLMKKYDVVICPTARSLTHTDARRGACTAGARVATMPGISEEVMIRTLKADYQKIAARTRKLSEILEVGKVARVTTERGTNITLPIEGIHAISSTGLVTEPGTFGNLPSGESYMMPQENKSSGVILVDGSFAGIGKIDAEPIEINVKNGFAVEIKGGAQAKQLDEMLKPLGKDAYNIAELGIGTNDGAIVTGQILEDEKVMGTVHIALGNNKSMGGTVGVGIHVDGVILKPTLYVDDRCIMENGDLNLD